MLHFKREHAKFPVSGVLLFLGTAPIPKGHEHDQGVMYLAEQRAPTGLSPSIAHGMDWHCHRNPPAPEPPGGATQGSVVQPDLKTPGEPEPLLE